MAAAVKVVRADGDGRDHDRRGGLDGTSVTLFTGQWADLPLAELAPKVAGVGL